MSKQKKELAVKRLKRVLTVDKVSPSSVRLGEVLKSDLVLLFNNYMDVDNLQLDINFDQNGVCYVTVNVISNKLKNFSAIL
ncbi:MAG: cell division topological specificity factor MinE [Clostridiales bacterium]|jgi:septum formation topological specificity factor MinE|nr:cell division topological specificity factor MinE [Clostridiales bacterium]HHW90263.1 cell division topological specificity factor MinE [Clostridiales bacterium]